MNIGIQASTLCGFGSKSVGLGIIHGLSSIDTSHLYHAWIPETWELSSILRTRLYPTRPGIFSKFITENIKIRSACFSSHLDCLFSLTDTSIPSCPVPHLLLVQQAYLAYSSNYWPSLPSRFLNKIKLMQSYFEFCKKTVSAFTVQTESMRHHLAVKYDISEDSIFVVPTPLNIPSSVTSEPNNFISDEPYLSYVASPSPHKNHMLLPDIMRSLLRMNI